MNIRRSARRGSTLVAGVLVALSTAGCGDEAATDVPSIEVPGESGSSGTSGESPTASPTDGVPSGDMTSPGDAPSPDDASVSDAP
ncbi:MAG: hypothetical protein ACTHXO_10400 [Actinomycetaceae bacterium]